MIKYSPLAACIILATHKVLTESGISPDFIHDEDTIAKKISLIVYGYMLTNIEMFEDDIRGHITRTMSKTTCIIIRPTKRDGEPFTKVCVNYSYLDRYITGPHWFAEGTFFTRCLDINKIPGIALDIMEQNYIFEEYDLTEYVEGLA